MIEFLVFLCTVSLVLFQAEGVLLLSVLWFEKQEAKGRAFSVMTFDSVHFSIGPECPDCLPSGHVARLRVPKKTENIKFF